jgi:methionyl-tRNA formyltransferase
VKIVIAASKSWFSNYEEIGKLSDLQILWLRNREDLQLEKLIEFKPEYVFFPHWNWVIDKSIYNTFKCIVFHTAPLPYGRGGSPIQNLILEGFKTSPVNAILVGEEIDAGDILGSREVSLDGKLSEIFTRISGIVIELILEITSGEFVSVPQSGIPVIFKRRTGTDNQIPSTNIGLVDLYDRIRMLDSPDYPKAYIAQGNFVVEFFNAHLVDGTLAAQAIFKVKQNKD